MDLLIATLALVLAAQEQTATFTDERAGVTIDIPEGWVLQFFCGCEGSL